MDNTKICNLALHKLGANRITDMLDGSRNSQLCSDIFQPTVDEVLRMHPWNCALERQSLARLATDPISGFDCQYTLPTVPYCLRALEINDSPDYKFKVEGRNLLTNETSVDLLYIKRITNPNEFDPLLVQAISSRLACYLALPVSQSASAKDRMEQDFHVLMSSARSLDAQEGGPDQFETSTWINSRLT